MSFHPLTRRTRNQKKKWNSLLILGMIVLGAMLSCGCSSTQPHSVTVTHPPLVFPPPPSKFMAAAVEVDLTPPPGYPIFGYSIAGAKEAHGYQTRLKGRVLVLDSPEGGRVFILQADLGAPSALLTRRIAAAAADVGAAPDRMMFGVTHTHGGPGGYFGTEFYNAFGAGAGGFDPDILDWLTGRFSDGIHQAVADLAPAVVAHTTYLTSGLIRNRSIPAWKRNFRYTCPDRIPKNVDENMTVVRIDRVTDGTSGGTPSVPLAALIVFPIHSTCMTPQEDLYEGDLHSVATRTFTAMVRERYGSARFVVAFLNGAEGDVSPNWDEQNEAETIRLGSELGGWAFKGFERLDGSLHAPRKLSRAYAEVGLPGAMTAEGRICERGEVGRPTAGGAEDGYSGLEFLFQEGDAKVDPSGCQSYKITLMKFVQRYVFNDHFFPLIVPFQVFRINDLLLVTVPGEPTTEVGRAIKRSVAERVDSDPVQVAVVGLANDYAGYFTTAEEFGAQHYEGASTLYGPLQYQVAVDQLTDLAGRLSIKPDEELYVRTRTFFTGKVVRFANWGGPCQSDQWTPGETLVTRDGNRIRQVVFDWQGLSEGEDCDGLPYVGIHRGGIPLVWNGLAQDDNSLRMTVRSAGAGGWTATWTPPTDGLCDGDCEIVVTSSQGDTIRSARF